MERINTEWFWRSFPKSWNSLPKYFKETNSHSLFKKAARGFLDPIHNKVSAEVSVKHTDNSSGTSGGSATLVDTPQPQSSLSTNIVPDYTFYSLAYYSQGTHICGIYR